MEKCFGHSVCIVKLIRFGVLFVILQGLALQTLAQDPTFVYNDEIVIGFTSQFQFIWNDQGSGADNDVSIWRPIPPQGFYSIGDILAPRYDEPTGKRVAFVVAPLTPTAMAEPIDFRLVWNDMGSGGDYDGAIYEPICPNGYASLGHVAGDYNGPYSVQIPIACVRQNLLVRGTLSNEWIVSDQGSGADRNMSAWPIYPVTAPKGKAYLSAGTFFATDKYEKPSGANIYTLQLDIKEQKEQTDGVFQPPQLTGNARPPRETNICNTTVSSLPWFAVKDSQFSDADKIMRSPTYTLEQKDCYTLQQFYYNSTLSEQEQTVEYTEGFSQEATKEFSNTTEVSISTEVGSELYGVSTTVTLTNSFTFGSSNTTTSSQETKVTRPLKVAPNTAIALYVIESTYSLTRADGTPVVTPFSGIQPASSYITEFNASASPSQASNSGTTTQADTTNNTADTTPTAPTTTLSGLANSTATTSSSTSGSLSAGFDYFEVTTQAGGEMNIATLGLVSDCVGFANETPNYELTWSGSGQILYIGAVPNDEESSDDLTLIVSTPDGSVLCNNDSVGTIPIIELNNPVAGTYNIWVGNFKGSNLIESALAISETSFE